MSVQTRNQGAAVPDLIAVGHQQEDVQTWRARNNIDFANQIKLVKITHMRYQHPDLNEISQFLAGNYGTRPMS